MGRVFLKKQCPGIHVEHRFSNSKTAVCFPGAGSILRASGRAWAPAGGHPSSRRLRAPVLRSVDVVGGRSAVLARTSRSGRETPWPRRQKSAALSSSGERSQRGYELRARIPAGTCASHPTLALGRAAGTDPGTGSDGPGRALLPAPQWPPRSFGAMAAFCRQVRSHWVPGSSGSRAGPRGRGESTTLGVSRSGRGTLRQEPSRAVGARRPGLWRSAGFSTALALSVGGAGPATARKGERAVAGEL